MGIFTVIILIFIALLLFLLIPFVPFSFRLTADKKIETSFNVFGKSLKKKSSKKSEGKKADILKLIKLIFSERSAIFNALKFLLKKSTVTDFKLHIVSSSEDAAETALLYGGICAVIYPAVAFLETVITVKTDDIKIVCDYENNCPSLFFFVNLKVSIFSLLRAYVKISPTLKNIKEVKENDK